jgi:hypothetical protein
MTIATLADVRRLMGHLPVQHRDKATWRYAAAELKAAERSGDTADVSIALRVALSLDGDDKYEPPASNL